MQLIGNDEGETIRPEHLVRIVSITTVPVPPVLWLFGSGLLGLPGMSRRKKIIVTDEAAEKDMMAVEQEFAQ